ncbi:MAG: molybdenum cofactor biosynthesis protein MoaE, partial [Candidatus Competibacter sp.]|nr:molybdenum cofactor biosynthesis protein MoaE [Candidatus Competibacter sp.]
MKVELRATPFDPLLELGCYQAGLDERLSGRYGATAIFIGTMRDFNDGDTVQEMTLEHYPGMTERHLQRIVESAAREWPLLDALLIHR